MRFVATFFLSFPALRDEKKDPFARSPLSFCQSRAVAAPQTRFFGTSLRGGVRATPHRAPPCAVICEGIGDFSRGGMAMIMLSPRPHPPHPTPPEGNKLAS